MSPLMAAMTFASASVVTKLLDAGAPVERDGLKLLGERPCTFRGAVIAGKHENPNPSPKGVDSLPPYLALAPTLTRTRTRTRTLTRQAREREGLPRALPAVHQHVRQEQRRLPAALRRLLVAVPRPG